MLTNINQKETKQNPYEDAIDNYTGLSKSTPWYSVAKSTSIMYLRLEIRYRGQLIANVIQLALFTFFFAAFALAVNFRGEQFTQFGEQEIFLFFLTGLTLLFLQGTALWVPLQSVERDLKNGTLEYLYFTPNSKYGYYLGYVLGSSVLPLIMGIIPLTMLIFLLYEVSLEALFLIALVVLFTIGTLTAFGIMIALMGVLWKNITGIAGILNIAFQFLSGAFIPISTLPEFLQIVSWLLPFTWAYDLIRYYSYNGSWVTILPVELEWLILGIFLVFYTILAKFLLKKVERYSKAKGLHLL